MTVASGGKPSGNGGPGASGGPGYPASSHSSRADPETLAWLDEIVELVESHVVVLDQSHRILSVNKRFCDFCATAHASLVGRHFRDVANGTLYAPELQDALAYLQDGDSSEKNRRIRIDLPVNGGGTLAAIIWRLSSAFNPAETLLLLDVPIDATLDRENPSALTLDALPDALGAETLHHDLRQPLQTLSLLQGVLAMREEDPSRRSHIARLREAIEALTGMLDMLNDLHRSTSVPSALGLVEFPIEPVLHRLRSEFSYHAEVKGLRLKVVSSRAVVQSDSRSLEQLIRALLLVAVKMTTRGKVLLGCRHRGSTLRIEIWNEGEVIGSGQQQDMLDEFHRDTPLADKAGIVQSIVKPLSEMLGLSVMARSRPGTGLLFSAEVPMSQTSHSDLARETAMVGAHAREHAARGVVAAVSVGSSDNQALKLLLQEVGFRVVAVRQAQGRIEIESAGGMQPEVIVGDFQQLANGFATHVVQELRDRFGQHMPAVIIADEAPRATTSALINDPVTYLHKPATAEEIASQVSQALRTARDRLALHHIKEHRSPSQTTFIVDDDRLLLDAMSSLLKARGEHVEVYSSAESFLESYSMGRRGCLVVDDKLPGLQGVNLLETLKAQGVTLPSIVITGHGNIATAVRAMKVGAVDYIEKPVHHGQLLAAIDRALEIDKAYADILSRQQELAARYATLTQRERQVMDLVAKGASSKAIGRMLNISQRTVESHRAAVMKRMGANSLSDLIHAVMELRLPQDQ